MAAAEAHLAKAVVQCPGHAELEEELKKVRSLVA